jgi:hypothetical protein
VFAVAISRKTAQSAEDFLNIPAAITSKIAATRMYLQAKQT